MIEILWDNKFSVGHNRIDHEHQVFLDLIKNASMMDEMSEPKEKILRLLTEVRKYADFHFFSEENIMLDCIYPEYAEHKREHEVLLSRLDDHLNDYRMGEISLEQIVDYLFEWFALHTSSVDKKLGDYIRMKSVG